jgi:hypothetical protein
VRLKGCTRLVAVAGLPWGHRAPGRRVSSARCEQGFGRIRARLQTAVGCWWTIGGSRVLAGPLVTMYPSLRHVLLLVASKGRRGVNSCPSLPVLVTCRQSRVPEGCRLAAPGLRPASLRGTPLAGESALPVGRLEVEAFACLGMSRIPKWLESSLTTRPVLVRVPWFVVVRVRVQEAARPQ